MQHFAIGAFESVVCALDGIAGLSFQGFGLSEKVRHINLLSLGRKGAEAPADQKL